MKMKLGIIALLAAVTLARGQDMPTMTNYVVSTNGYFDWSYTTTNSCWVTNTLTTSTRVTFGEGITLDTKTGEVEFPASATNMTEAARQFWRAVCDVSGAEQPKWLKEAEAE